MIASAAVAETTRLEWSGFLRFDPSEQIRGGTLGALMAELYGPEAWAGDVAVSGTVAIDTSAKTAVQNYRFAAAPNAVQELSVTLGAVVASADFSLIQGASSSSTIGAVALPDGTFCTAQVACDRYDLRAPGWGSLAYTIAESSYGFSSQRGTYSPETGASFGVLAGGTDAFGDFTPALATQAFGTVAIDGLSFWITLAPDVRIGQDQTLPHFSRFSNPAQLHYMGVSFDLEIFGQPERIELIGRVTGISVTQ